MPPRFFASRLCLALLVPPLWLVASATEPARPNIVFIMSDDHANRAISVYGGDLVQTPHIDRLAHEGMRFNNAFCTNAICGPARAVILTGKYSHRNGYMVNETTSFDGSQVTFPQLFQTAGYQTALIGKWHLDSDPTGFDFWEILIGQGQYHDPEFNRMGAIHRESGYVTDLTSDKTVHWLREQRDPSKPFVLLTQHKAPHANFYPPPRYEHSFDDVTFPEPANLFDDYAGRAAAADNDMRIDPDLALQFQDDDPRWTLPAELTGEARTRWLYQFYLRNYLGCVRAVDDAVGEVLATLEELDLSKNTIVVYTSDQGFFLGEHGWYDKRFMYEESLRQPLIVRYPGHIPAGAVDDHLVLNLDFAETFLDYAGIPIPAEMQGRSLRPLLSGNPVDLWRRSIYYHYYEYPGWHYVKRHYGVRTGRFKLIHFYHDIDTWELYDLAADPTEMTNRIDDPAYAQVQSALTRELARLQAQYGDSPELARETIERFPHGSRPAWGRATNMPGYPNPRPAPPPPTKP